MEGNIFNVTAIKNLMDEVPKGQRLNNFLEGAVTQISEEQRKNVYEIIKKRTDDILDYISKSIQAE